MSRGRSEKREDRGAALRGLSLQTASAQTPRASEQGYAFICKLHAGEEEEPFTRSVPAPAGQELVLLAGTLASRLHLSRRHS